jgi:hypothetical protein
MTTCTPTTSYSEDNTGDDLYVEQHHPSSSYPETMTMEAAAFAQVIARVPVARFLAKVN